MRKEAKNWWKQAKKDLEVAEKNFEIEEYYVTVFFCQQSVEKALKALFIIKKSKFPEQTHSLIYLGKQLQIDHQFFSLLQDLTPEFVTTRYPDIVGEAPFELYGKDNTLYFLKRTKEFFKWIENQIQ
ncbi:MAG: HEPN domain-containing protein [Candidatus Helarchaeota archaeon]